MFDLPPTIEQHCPQEAVQLVREINTNNNEIIFKLLNNPNFDLCQDSLLGFFFSTLKGNESSEYIRALLMFAGAKKNDLTEKTYNIIYDKIEDIPYIDNINYPQTYFHFLSRFNITPTNKIRNIETSGQWHKSRYLSYMGDWEEFNYMLEIMKQEEDADEVISMSYYFLDHPEDMKEKLIKTFENDQRTFRNIDITLGELIALMFSI